MHGAIVVALTSLALLGATQEDGPTEANLRAADAEQRRILISGDAAAQERFMHPNFINNGATNVIRRKPEVVRALAEGNLASDGFERAIEGTAITGSVGIVMGDETVTPSATSDLGRRYPGRTLRRRFTNVFLWENGQWWFLARQATIVSPP